MVHNQLLAEVSTLVKLAGGHATIEPRMQRGSGSRQRPDGHSASIGGKVNVYFDVTVRSIITWIQQAGRHTQGVTRQAEISKYDAYRHFLTENHGILYTLAMDSLGGLGQQFISFLRLVTERLPAAATMFEPSWACRTPFSFCLQRISSVFWRHSARASLDLWRAPCSRFIDAGLGTR
jgi:hypothetical protein